MSSALATREPFLALVREMAQSLPSLAPEQYGAAIETLKLMEGAVERLREHAEEVVKKAVLEGGSVVTEKGTKALQLGDYYLRAIPNRTGIDPKKLEARLRSKGLDPANHMRATIAYAVDEVKLARLVEDGLMTDADMQGCKYTTTYKLAASKVADGVPNE